MAGPSPEPWHLVATQLIQAIQVRDLASRLEGSLRDAVIRKAALAIDDVLDDLGKPVFPPGRPKPWWEVVSSLSLVAHSLQDGSLKEDVLNVAARVIEVMNRT